MQSTFDCAGSLCSQLLVFALVCLASASKNKTLVGMWDVLVACVCARASARVCEHTLLASWHMLPFACTLYAL